MYPKTLALIDSQADDAVPLARHVEAEGMDVRLFADAEGLMGAPEALGFDFYVIDHSPGGIDGAALIRRLRQSSDVGVLVLMRDPSPERFREVITAGADMVLARPAHPDQLMMAIAAVQRRVARPGTTDSVWRLDPQGPKLVTPEGTQIPISEADRIVLECFVRAGGQPVTREALLTKLGREPHPDEPDDGLSATIYRLRRRIERASPTLLPLQSRSRVGYVFRAPLELL